MNHTRNYYLNDYFDIFNNTYNKEKEYMKTDIYEKDNKCLYICLFMCINKDKFSLWACGSSSAFGTVGTVGHQGRKLWLND